MKRKHFAALTSISFFLILFYILFESASKREQYGINPELFGILSVKRMVSFSSLGFFLLTFVMGSLFAVIYSASNTLQNYTKTYLKQYRNYICGTLICVMLTVLVCVLTVQDKAIYSRWTTTFSGQIKGILANILGVPSLFGTKWLASGTWRYLWIIVVLSLIAPLICFLAKYRFGTILVLFSFLFPYILRFTGSGHRIYKYYFIFAIAIIFETKKIWEKVSDFVNKHILNKVVLIVFNICTIALCLLFKVNYYNIGYIFSSIVILSFACFIIFIINGTVKLQEKDVVLTEGAVFLCAISVPICLILLRSYIFSNNLIMTYGRALLVMSVLFVIFSLIVYYGPLLMSKINTSARSFEIISSLCMVLINFVLVLSTATPTYMTNDDTAIANALSGKALGEIYPNHKFVNCCLTYPISFLYHIVPTIPWWYVISLFAIALGMFAIHYTFVHIANENQLSVWMAIIVAEVFDMSLVWYLIHAVSFTIIPAMLGCFSIMILLLLEKVTKPFLRAILIIIFGINTLWAVCHRQESGLIVLCFYMVIFVFIFLKTDYDLRGYLKKAIPFIAVFLLAFLCIGINRVEKDKVDGKDFREFYHIRSMFMDYPHDTYVDNPELFNEVGWNENTYLVMSSWNFIDDNITTENLEYIIEHSNKKSQTVISKTLQGVMENPFCEFLLLIWMSSFAVWLLCTIMNFKKEWLITGALNNIGASILIVYQILTGRILYRSMAAVLIPAVFINTILILYSYKKKTTILSIILISMLGTIGTYSIIQNVNVKNWESLEERAQNDIEICQYLDKHSDNIYISTIGTLAKRDPFNDYSLGNLIYTGGSEYYSDLFYKKLKRNGLEVLNGAVFKRSNVFLMTQANVKDINDLIEGTHFKAFFEELKKQYGAIGFEQVDIINGSTFVYRFVF